MPVYTSSIEVTADYPTIKPSLNLNFARSRALDPRITFTRTSTATYIGRDGLVKYAGEDEARFDHDPDTLESLGLLLEESRTNLIADSGDISQFSQVIPANQTLTANAAVAPDGTTTATRYTTNTPTGSGLQWISRGDSGSYSNVTVTGSFWARADATRTLQAHISDSIAGTTYSYTVTTEWQRFTFTKTQNTGATVAVLYPVFISNEPAGLNVYLWGAQLEVGSFATSYIPTPAGAVATREADNAHILYDGWYDNSSSVKPSTFVGKFRVYDFGATRMVAEGSDGSTLKDFSMNTLANSSELQFVHRYTANDSYDSTIGAGITINTPTTFAFSYDGTGGDITGSANGSTPNVGTDDLGTTSQAGGDRMRIGSRGNNTLYLNGTLAELRYYKFKASSAQLLLLQ